MSSHVLPLQIRVSFNMLLGLSDLGEVCREVFQGLQINCNFLAASGLLAEPAGISHASRLQPCPPYAHRADEASGSSPLPFPLADARHVLHENCAGVCE